MAQLAPLSMRLPGALLLIFAALCSGAGELLRWRHCRCTALAAVDQAMCSMHATSKLQAAGCRLCCSRLAPSCSHRLLPPAAA